MRLSQALAVSLLIAFSSSAALAQYAAVAVSNGGSISGVVKVKGDIPADEIKEIIKNKAQCGETIAAEKYVIAAGGEVKWAVAILEGIAAGKALDTKAKVMVDNNDCRFAPHVLVAPTKGKLQIKNSDPMLHNSHFYLVSGDKKKNVINLALPKQGQVLTKAKILRKPGLLSLVCDAHDFMQGYVWSLPHPYGAVTDDQGAFALADVPAGTHTLKVWHEALGEKTSTVTVEAGVNTEVVIEF